MYYIHWFEPFDFETPCTPGIHPNWFRYMTLLCIIEISLLIFRTFAYVFIIDLTCNFFGSIFVWFWCQCNGGSIEWIWKYSSLFTFLDWFEKDKCSFLFHMFRRITLWSYPRLYFCLLGGVCVWVCVHQIQVVISDWYVPIV